MKSLYFSESEIVKIENPQQYNEICHHFRNPVTWEEFVNRFPGFLNKHSFPFYLEHVNSVTRGASIGISFLPVGFCYILTFEEATKER